MSEVSHMVRKNQLAKYNQSQFNVFANFAKNG